MVNTVIFDMDGVLFDTERISCLCWEEVAVSMGLGDLGEGLTGCIGLNKNDSKALMHRLYGEDFPLDLFWGTVSSLMHEKIDRHGLPVKAGVVELLDFLTEQGYKIGLASSSGKQGILRNLKQAGITDYFQYIVGGDMVKHSKPDPDIYLKACEGLGAQPGESMAIEDSPNGIRAAFHAGMKPVMVPDLIEPDQEIRAMLHGLFGSLLEVKESLIIQN